MNLPQHLEPEIWREFERTYVGPDYDEIWESLLTFHRLFARTARTVGDHYGYRFPSAESEGAGSLREIFILTPKACYICFGTGHRSIGVFATNSRYAICYARLVNGKVIHRLTLVEAGEGLSGEIPTEIENEDCVEGPNLVTDPISTPRFAVTPDGRLFVILPPQLFGLEAHLGFDSTRAGATIGSVGPERLELGADDWDLVVILDGDGRVAPETQVVFELVFEERLRRVRCRPGDPAVGTLSTTALPDSGELSGSFDIELARCEDADTGTPLGWPPQPLVLHGSFDRLPLDTGAERR